MADQIQAERIADLINKEKMFAYQPNAEIGKSYNALLSNARELIAQINPRFEAEDSAGMRDSLPMAGHVVGRHVTNTIKEGFNERLELVTSPTQLFVAYNTLAPSLEQFSPEFILHVKLAETECMTSQ
jgi:hypothetical protein